MPIAAKPLFTDPVYDGAADPVVIYDRRGNRWLMFYTNRRATMSEPGVAWVHGTRIGIAESRDGGATWGYLGIADIDLGDCGVPIEQQTHWAPAVLEHGGLYHMHLSYVPGVFGDWNHPRHIVHLTSGDLLHWKKQSVLDLGSDKVIDSCILRLSDGRWRMWYKDERDGSHIHYADSADLSDWRHVGPAITGKPSEGPTVFHFRDRYWMITDEWCGLAVHHSADCETWHRQAGENLLAIPGKHVEDRSIGNHADVVVSGGRAYLFYFNHPGRTPEWHAAGGKHDVPATRRTVIHVAELGFDGDRLICDRDAPVDIALVP